MTWVWLLVCWGCLLAGFLLGAWWATTGKRAQSLQDALYIVHLEEEVTQLKRKVEWERKRADVYTFREEVERADQEAVE